MKVLGIGFPPTTFGVVTCLYDVEVQTFEFRFFYASNISYCLESTDKMGKDVVSYINKTKPDMIICEEYGTVTPYRHKYSQVIGIIFSQISNDYTDSFISEKKSFILLDRSIMLRFITDRHLKENRSLTIEYIKEYFNINVNKEEVTAFTCAIFGYMSLVVPDTPIRRILIEKVKRKYSYYRGILFNKKNKAHMKLAEGINRKIKIGG